MTKSLDKGHVLIRDVEISFSVRGATHQAVKRTTLEIRPGEFICLLGPSGCGKSTLLKCIAGFVKPSHGRVEVDGVTVEKPNPDRGMVFQQNSLFPWMTVRQNIAFGPNATGRGGAAPVSVADTFLAMIGLAKFADRYPKELSGGMQQRVGIARALANYPSLLLMDEPFGALDSQTRRIMQANLLEIWREFGITVIFVTHDIDEAVYLADRVLVMSAGPGEIIADITVDLPRPRTDDCLTEPAFLEARAQCLRHIRAESLKAFEMH